LANNILNLLNVLFVALFKIKSQYPLIAIP